MKTKLFLTVIICFFSLSINAQLKDTMNFNYFVSIAQKQIGLQIKDWELNDLKGIKHSSKDLKNKIILLNFWAAGCGACIKINEDLVVLDSMFRKKGFEVVDVECDKRHDILSINAFINRYNICKETLISGYELSLKYSVRAYPTLYLIDRTGKIVYCHLGYFYYNTKDKMISEIEKIK